jgi:hypothetical protein
MSDDASPSRVRTFVADHIEKPEDLQLLLLLVESGDRWWDAGGAASALRAPLRQARQALDRLARQNLLDIRITGDVRYQFRPGTSELRDDAIACCEAYRANPLAVMTDITGSARRTIRDFADAFRIRSDDNDR